MKIKHQLSIATLVMAGFFVTGCSQSEGGSQVSGGSQQQVEGGGQVAGGSQQQQEEVVVATPQKAMVKPAPVRRAPVRRAPVRRAPVRRSSNPWLHYHPEAPKCAKTRKHSHKFKRTGARHHHRYACTKARGVRRAAPVRRHRAAPVHRAPTQRRAPVVDVRALQEKLKAKGFYRGPIDGIVGPGTRSALKRFMNR